jgi:hypothetical protein
MDYYAQGHGHTDLATQLNISTAYSLALPGSCNNRIVRTTLKDSYTTDQPTLYVIGLSFLSRSELTVGQDIEVEGRWVSFQNQINSNRIADFWSDEYSQQAINHHLTIENYSVKDRLEDLMFKILAMTSDLISRNHQIIIFRQPGEPYVYYLNEKRFEFLKKCVNIIDGLEWGSLEFQAKKNIKYKSEDQHLPKFVRHPAPGEHNHLNKFLIEYIATHKLL